MKLTTKIGCYIVGWNPKILAECSEASYKALKKNISALLILSIIWFVVGFNFAGNYIGIENPIYCALVGFVFTIIAIQIERQIILSVTVSKGVQVIRFIIAMLMAVIGASIFDQILFRNDIEKELTLMRTDIINEELPKRAKIIDEEIQRTYNMIDSISEKVEELNISLEKKPVLYTYETETVKKPYIDPETGEESLREEKTVKRVAVENPRLKERDSYTQMLAELRIKADNYNSQKINIESNLRKELEENPGFLEELTAMFSILSREPVALIFYVVLFLFLMALECFILMSKVGDTRCDYEVIVEHQMKVKSALINKLGEGV